MEIVESVEFVAIHVFFLAIGLPVFLLKWKKMLVIACQWLNLFGI